MSGVGVLLSVETTLRHMPLKDKTRRSAYNRERYLRNAERNKAYSKAYYHAHKNDPIRRAAALDRARKHRAKDPVRDLISHVRGRARRRGIPFSITKSDVTWPTTCPVLGLRLDYSVLTKGGVAQPNSPSIDRGDPRKGYIKGNVQVISWRANHIKTNATPEELRRVAAYCELFC